MTEKRRIGGFKPTASGGKPASSASPSVGGFKPREPKPFLTPLEQVRRRMRLLSEEVISVVEEILAGGDSEVKEFECPFGCLMQDGQHDPDCNYWDRP